MKRKPFTAPAPTCLASLPSTGASRVSPSLYLTGRIWSPPHTWTQPADHYCNNPQSRAAPVLHTWKCHTIQEWLTEIGVQSISGVTTNERKVKENRPDRGIIMLNWTPYLGICQVTQTFSFVIREIERCVIFHHIQQTCLQIKTVFICSFLSCILFHIREIPVYWTLTPNKCTVRIFFSRTGWRRGLEAPILQTVEWILYELHMTEEKQPPV